MSQFVYASANAPCPVCGRKKDCRRNDTLHFCLTHRMDSGAYIYLGDSRDGTWGLFAHEAERHNRRERTPRTHAAPRPAPTEPSKPAGPSAFDRWSRITSEHGVPLNAESREQHAGRLGLPGWTFDLIKVRLLPADPWECRDSSCLYWLERDGEGKLTAIVRRYGGGKKIASGPRGLTIPDGWQHRPGPVFVPEGMSDTLALSAMGLPAVGRPNSRAGAEHLAQLLGPTGRDVVILGENDRKDDGRWEGRDGALDLARKLTDLLGRPVRVAFPPADAKDAREWFKANRRDDLAGMGRDFAAAALAGAVEVGGEADRQAQQERTNWIREAVRQALERAAAERPADPWEEETRAAAECRQARSDFDRHPCHHCKRILNRRKNTFEPMLMDLRCEKRAECRGCREWLIERDLIAAALHFRQAAGLYELYCEPGKAWAALHRRLRRLGGEYQRTEDAGRFWVVTDVPVPGAVPVGVAQALATLRLLLESSCSECRSTATSHGWRLPRQESEGEYERLGLVSPRLTTDALCEIAEAHQAAPVAVGPDRSGRRRSGWRFLRPEWSLEDSDRLAFDLFAGEVLPQVDFALPDLPPRGADPDEPPPDFGGDVNAEIAWMMRGLCG